MFPFQENDKEEFPEDKLTWTQSLIIDLGLKEHPDGGYYAETDRSPFAIRNPLGDGDPLDNMRPTSTAIYYLLNTARPNQFFHRNQSRTIHSLHEGVGICLLLYPPEMSSKTAHIQELYKAKRGRKTNIDTFGGYERRRLDNGWTIEKFGVGREFGIYQWVVEGGVYKASFLLDYDSSFGYIEPERKQIEDVHNRDGLFITEVVSPGFDLADHNFMNKETFNDIFHTKELRAEFRSLLK